MRWLLLLAIIACSDSDGRTKECCESADAVGKTDNADYIYNVYQFSDDLIQDWGETNKARIFTRLKLTADGYPDTVHLAIALDPFQAGGIVREVRDGKKILESLRWVVKPLPVVPLPGLYVLPFSAFPLKMGYHVYMSWDHTNRQVGKVMLVVDVHEEEDQSCRPISPDGTQRCSKRGIVFAEAERMPYDQAKARAMYLERKVLPSPANQWTILDMHALGHLHELYRLTGSPTENLELEDENMFFLGEENAGEKLTKIMSYADKIIDNFSNISGVHSTNGLAKKLK